jgi:putative hydrolases of HD superfamily
MLLNYHNEGDTWRTHGITSDRVLNRNQVIADGSEALWDYARRMIESAVEQGFLE